MNTFQKVSLNLLFSSLRNFTLWPKFRIGKATVTSISTILTVLSFNERGLHRIDEGAEYLKVEHPAGLKSFHLCD